MSEDFYVGLSREQVLKLLAGEIVGKRPYYKQFRYPEGKRKYHGTLRIHITMLTEEEEAKEPEGAFSWS